MVAARFVVVGQRVERFEADPARRHHVNSQRTCGYIGMRMNNSWAREAVSGRDQAEEEVKWTAHRGVDGREDRGASMRAVTGDFTKSNETKRTQDATTHIPRYRGRHQRPSGHVMDVTD